MISTSDRRLLSMEERVVSSSTRSRTVRRPRFSRLHRGLSFLPAQISGGEKRGSTGPSKGICRVLSTTSTFSFSLLHSRIGSRSALRSFYSSRTHRLTPFSIRLHHSQFVLSVRNASRFFSSFRRGSLQFLFQSLAHLIFFLRIRYLTRE